MVSIKVFIYLRAWVVLRLTREVVRSGLTPLLVPEHYMYLSEQNVPVHAFVSEFAE